MKHLLVLTRDMRSRRLMNLIVCMLIVAILFYNSKYLAHKAEGEFFCNFFFGQFKLADVNTHLRELFSYFSAAVCGNISLCQFFSMFDAFAHSEKNFIPLNEIFQFFYHDYYFLV